MVIAASLLVSWIVAVLFAPLIGVALLLVTLGLGLFVWRRRAWLLSLGEGSRLARWLALDGRRATLAALE
uniref:hypothetical protein n=1 Tax=Escherichia coli TaxID=562 RepID=UPI0013D8D714